MDKTLLSILCCPVTHKGLSIAGGDLMNSVNEAIGEGRLHNRNGCLLYTSDAADE